MYWYTLIKMINGQNFVNVLRKINYPEAEKLDGSSFDYMFEHFELLPFLESFCNTIGDENVLTSEEFTELKTLPPDIIEGCFEEAMLPISVKQSKEELNDEVEFLKAELHALAKNNEILGEQISRLRSQQMNLVTKTEGIETLLSYQRKKYRKLRDENAPSSERKVAADLEHMISHVQVLENLLGQPADSQMSTSTKTFYQMDLGPYLKTENAALEHMRSYINMSLNEELIQNQRRLSYDSGDGLCESTMVSDSCNRNSPELSLLMENLKFSEEALIKVSYEKSKAQTTLQFYKEKVDLNRYLQTTSTLHTNREEAEQTLKRFKQEENRLLLSIPEVVQEYIQMERNWISVLHCRERLADCNSLLVKQKMPVELLCEQRARLELLSLFLETEKSDLQNIGQLILNTNSVLENERDSLLKREMQMAKILEETVPFDEGSEKSVVFSLHKILDTVADTPYFYVTPECLQEMVLSLKNDNCELDEKLESTFRQHLQYVKTIENNSIFYDDLLYEKKWNSSLHPASLLQNITSDLNKGHLKLQDLEAIIMKIISSYQMKQKMIQQNVTLKKARHLFVSALTNPSRLHQIISEIRLQMENSGSNRTHSEKHEA